jgi:hypothetical protein
MLTALVFLAPGGPLLSQPEKTESQRLSVAVAEAQKVVEKIRGVKFTQPVRSEMLQEENLAAILEKKLLEDLPAPFPKYSAALSAVGLIEPTSSLQKKIVNLYSRQVAGFYDPEEAKFYVVAGRSRIAGGGAESDPLFGELMEEALLVHELTHALQDQRLGLAGRMEKLKDSTDAMLALQAALEGEATVVMAEGLLEKLPADARSRFSGDSLAEMMSSLATSSVSSQIEGSEGVPEFFIRELLFPYSAGTTWIQKKRSGGKGWAALDENYSRFPATTAEILRGEKPKKPRPAPEPISIPARTRFLFADTFGEWVLGFLLEKAGHGQDAQTLAECWQDDRIVFFEPRNAKGLQIGFTWRIHTRSRETAVDLAAALAPLYTGRPSRMRPTIEVKDDLVEISRLSVPAGSD